MASLRKAWPRSDPTAKSRPSARPDHCADVPVRIGVTPGDIPNALGIAVAEAVPEIAVQDEVRVRRDLCMGIPEWGARIIPRSRDGAAAMAAIASTVTRTGPPGITRGPSPFDMAGRLPIDVDFAILVLATLGYQGEGRCSVAQPAGPPP